MASHLTGNLARSILLLLFSLLSFSACRTNSPKLIATTSTAVEIAILLPISSDNSLAVQQYHQLIRLGLKDGSSQALINITTYDATSQDQILAAMDQIIQRRTKIILGPLYSPSTAQIAQLAKDHNIIIITLSNNPALASSQILVFGHAPFKPLTSVIDYYLKNRYQHFITLLPAGSSSQQTSKLIQEKLVEHEAILVRSEFYLNNSESISQAVKLVSDSVNNLNETANAPVTPVICVADNNPSMLHLLFSNLALHHVDQKAIIAGDHRVNIANLANLDISFAGSLNWLNNSPAECYRLLGINHLSFMHLMAYDLGRFTASLIGQEFSSEQFLAAVKSHHYLGLSGSIKFINSVASREYDVLQYRNGAYIAPPAAVVNSAL